MKTLILCALLAAAACLLPTDSPAGLIPNAMAGRYQLLNADVTITFPGAPGVDHKVFKIDTETGRTWIYFEGGNTAGAIHSEWHELGNAPVNARQPQSTRPD